MNIQSRSPLRLVAGMILLALALTGCQTRPQLKVTDMQPATVEPGVPGKSFWKDSVTYPFPVKYAHATDSRGVSWEVAYMDEFAGDPRAKSKAPTLVLVHGKGAASGYWSQLMKTALEAGVHVVAFDLPFYGKSIPGNLKNSYARTFDDTRVALHKILVDQLGIAKATYLGHSMGGQWVLGFALMYPRNVEKIILESSAGLEEYPRSIKLPSGELPWMDPSYAHDFDRWKQVWEPTFHRLASEEAQTPEQIRNFYYFKKKDPKTGEIIPAKVGFFHKDGPDAKWLTDTRVGMITGPKKEYEAWIVAYTRDIYSMGIELNREDPNSLYKRLTQITVPVFIAFGKEEPFIPTTVATGNTSLKMDIIKPAFEKLSKTGPAPVVKLYDNAGHFIHTDRPKQFDEDVVDFVYTGDVSGPVEHPETYKAAARALPEDMQAFVKSDEEAFMSKDIEKVMALYHKDYLDDGRDKAKQREFLLKVMPVIKQYQVNITDYEMKGNKAVIQGTVKTEYGVQQLPAGAMIIKQDGKWYWYGNQKK